MLDGFSAAFLITSLFLVGTIYIVYGFWLSAFSGKNREFRKLSDMYSKAELSGNYDEMINALNREDSGFSSGPAPRYFLALCYKSKGFFHEATDLLERIIEEKDFIKEIDEMKVLKIIIDVFEQTKNHTGIVEYCTRILKRFPEQHNFLYKKACSQMYLNDFISAAADLNIFLSREPYHVDAMVRLAECFYKTEEYTAMNDVCREALKIDEKNCSANFFSGVDAIHKNKVEAAKIFFRTAAGQSGKYSAEACKELGMIYRNIEDYENALKYFEKGLSLTSRDDLRADFKKFIEEINELIINYDRSEIMNLSVENRRLLLCSIAESYGCRCSLDDVSDGEHDTFTLKAKKGNEICWFLFDMRKSERVSDIEVSNFLDEVKEQECNRGIFITVAEFSESSYSSAQFQPVTLISGKSLYKLYLKSKKDMK